MSRLFFLFLSFSLFFPSFVFSAVCDYTQPSGTCGITSASFYDCEEDLLEAFNAASGSVVWSPYTCTSGCCMTTYGLPSGTQFWQKGTSIFVLCSGGECSSDPSDPPDPCADVNPKPEDACGAAQYVLWEDPDTCSYTCKCPDYVDGAQDAYDFDTCQVIPSDTPCSIIEISNQCPFGRDSTDWVTCDVVCKSCSLYQNQCSDSCPNGGSLLTCDDSNPGNLGICDCYLDCSSKEAVCISGCSSYGGVSLWACEDSEPHEDDTYTCICNEDIKSSKEISENVSFEGEPSPDPENDPDNDKTCADWDAECSPSCQFGCSVSPVTGKVTYHNCDCGDDPVGDPDDGAGGWLKKIENNTDKAAEQGEDTNKWLKGIKGNSDTGIALDNDRNSYLENLAENARRSVENQKVIDDSIEEGNSLAEEGNSLAAVANGYLADIAGLETAGSSDVPLDPDNVYSSTFTEGEGFSPVPENAFSEGLSDYIATGIPLISYIQGASINLSSTSPVLNMMFWGYPVNVDFSEYQSVIDLVGNILFALSILSGFMLIVARTK